MPECPVWVKNGGFGEGKCNNVGQRALSDKVENFLFSVDHDYFWERKLLESLNKQNVAVEECLPFQRFLLRVGNEGCFFGV